MHKIRTHHKHIDGKIFAWLTLIFMLGIGLVDPIFPNFIKTIVHSNEAVSLFYAGMALMSLLAGIATSVIFRKVKRTTITKAAFITMGIIFFSLIFITRLPEIAILQTIKVWSEMFILVALGLFVRDFAKSKNLGEEEGLHYKYYNMGAMIGPLIGGFIATNSNYESVFILAATVIFFGFGYFYHKHIVQNHPAIVDRKLPQGRGFIRNIKLFFSDKERTKAYLITYVVMLWVSFKRIYVPLYVVMSGYLSSMSGLIFALAILPLILFEVKVGEYADKHGVRKPIASGFLLMAVCLLMSFISPFPLINFLLIILVNLGLAFIEPLQESYLFKNTPPDEEDELYGIYMTADPVAYFSSSLIGAIVLFFLPFQFLFLVFGLIISAASFLSFRHLRH